MPFTSNIAGSPNVGVQMLRANPVFEMRDMLDLERALDGKAVVALLVQGSAFAGISLVVGGIGIMNVLLADVTERTREIEIRKPTGARGRDIRVQFLAESVAITAVGA